MIYPSIEQLSRNGTYNRYMLCVATAKCAREITDRQNLENQQAWHDAKDEKAAPRRVFSSEKPVRTAINHLDRCDFTIYLPEQQVDED